MEQSQKGMPLISVVMPAYNAEKYIAKAIESVITQTYVNWELIVIDDCSADGTLKIAQGFAKKDLRICVYHNDENLGVAKTRNRSLSLAKGEWVALLDSDDIWRREKLKKQVELALRTEADIVYSSYSLFTDKKRTDYIVPPSTNYESMLMENVIGCSTVLLRRLISEEHSFSPEFHHEDYALWLELLKAGYKAVGCAEVLVDYRVLNTSRSFNKWGAAKNRWVIYRKAEKLPTIKALTVFAVYMVRGVAKHKRM